MLDYSRSLGFIPNLSAVGRNAIKQCSWELDWRDKRVNSWHRESGESIDI